MDKLPYEPLGTNVLLRAPNPQKVGSIIIPDTAKAPDQKPVFEVCAIGSDCVVACNELVGAMIYVKHGGSLWPFIPDDVKKDEYLYYCADESDLAAIVK